MGGESVVIVVVIVSCCPIMQFIGALVILPLLFDFVRGKEVMWFRV